MGFKFIFTAISVYGLLCSVAMAEPVEDKRALLDFISNTSHSRIIDWDERTSACTNWTGVACNYDQSRITAVRLPAIGFKGSISANTISRLSALEILSLRSNSISGSFPTELFKLRNLTDLYLQFNNFHGPLPSNFPIWKNLSVLDLSNNGFNGTIPSSISNLTCLTSLDFSNNSFSGDVPALNIPSLQMLDLTNNNLTGHVPQSLSKFPITAFSGNNISTKNVSPPNPSSIIVRNKKHSSKFSEPVILGIAIGSCSVVFISIVLLLIITSRKQKDDTMSVTSQQKKENSTRSMTSDYQGANGKMTFFEGCNSVFDLEDLLRASAEVLGKGSFGTTYKAALEDATTVVVKRLKEVVVGRREFEHQMEIVGNIRHANVAPLRAYYYSKDEKLVVYDYYRLGSMSALLHGIAKTGTNAAPLDWETRVKIAIGTARGLAHIHSQSGGKLVHGNIKSSNIFLNPQLSVSVSDLGLAAVMSPISTPLGRATGYRAPEITDTRKASQASDVYSFGVILLELLTGKPAVHASGRGEEVVHLVRWVNSVVREEWTGEVFDVELFRYPDIEEEMVAMLQIGLSCVARMPDQRLRIGEVVKMVEEVRSFNTSNGRNGSPGPTANHAGEIGSS
ncbi:hypothetical protein OROHE_021901 [Orobanche hederae]